MSRPPLALTHTTVHWDRRIVLRDDAEVALTPMEFKLLDYLHGRANEIVPHGDLLEHVWDYARDSRSFTVYATVNRLRKKLEAVPKQPQHLLSTPGVGYQLHILQPLGPGPAPLPVVSSSFVGRRTLLDALDDHTEGLLVLTGPAGVGKTRLAHAWAVAQPAFWIDARGVRHVDGLLEATVAALGWSVPPDVDALAQRLGERRLVFDHVDGVVGPDLTEVFEAWATAGAVLLATSRRTLPGAPTMEVPRMEVAEAVELLQARASTVRSDLVLPPDEASDLVRAVDRLPLCIELAAQRLRLLPPRELTSALQGSLDVLAGGEGHHTSVRAALAASWELLSAAARAAAPQLARFGTPFPLSAAAAVVRLPDGAPWIGDVVSELVDHSLLDVRHGPEVRFAMLQIVRTFAREQDTEPGVDDRFGAYLADHLDRTSLDDAWSVIAAAPPPLARQIHLRMAACVLAQGPYPRLIESLRQSLTPRRPGHVDAVLALGRLFRNASRLHEAVDLLTTEAPDDPSGRCYDLLAAVLSALQRTDDAEAALAAARPHHGHDLTRRGEAQLVDGMLAYQRHDRALAERRFAEAVDTFRAAEVPAKVSSALNNLAILCRQRGAYDEAMASYREALELDDRPLFRARLLGNLGTVELCRGLPTTPGLLEEALAIHRRVGHLRGQSEVLINLGIWAMTQDHPDEARAALDEALTLSLRVDAPRNVAMATAELGILEVRLRRWIEASRRLDQALELAEQHHLLDMGTSAASWRALVAEARGEDASPWLARAKAADVQDPFERCGHLMRLSRLQPERATALREEAEALAEAHGIPAHTAEARAFTDADP